jgi:hypothetical protein
MTHEHQKPDTGRKWVAVSVASFDAVRGVLTLPYKTFVLLLAADGRGLSDQALHEHCRKLLNAGARYLCVWGPDSSRIHDACDRAATELGLNNDDAVIMTTWHDDESLEDAVWFAANAAFPDHAYVEAAGVLVALSIGSKGWDSQIRDYLEAGTPIQDEA